MDQIEDLELRHLFQIESAEHLQKLDAGLLQLEKTPNDQALIQEIFREAHSLKGSARMLGLIDIQEQANKVEDMLGEARSGKITISAELLKPHLMTLDYIRKLVSQAVGESALAENSSPDTPPKEVARTIEAKINSEPIEPVSSKTDTHQLAPDFRIDTLRVDAKKLDFLLTQTGELVVSRSRISHWRDEFIQLLNELDAGNLSRNEWVENARLMRSKLSEDTNRLNVITEEIESGIRNLRLLPISTLLEQFPRMVHDLASEEKKLVELVFEGEATVADKRIIEEMKAPLMHMLRNAIDHGIETPDERAKVGKPATGKILIRVSQDADHVRIDVIDDGRGLDLEAIRQQAIKRRLFSESEVSNLDENQLKMVLMTPGFSTNKMITDISGRGVGLDVVRSAVERMHGSFQMESEAGRGMTFSLNLPVSLTSTRVMILREWGETYALPSESIYFARTLRPGDLFHREDRECFYHGDEIISVNRLGSALGRTPGIVDASGTFICVVISVGEIHFGIIVDELRDEEEIVLKLPPAPIKRMRNLTGVTILDSGEVCAVLNPSDLLKSVHQTHQNLSLSGNLSSQIKSQKKKSILLVEDSIVTRMQEKRILEGAGYEVVTATDGVNAWGILATKPFDAIVSDIMMPNMDGLELTAKIRANPKYSDTPIILVTSLASEGDRRKGLELGADAYISKSGFDQSILLDSIARLT